MTTVQTEPRPERPTSKGEERIAELTRDRMCATCSFNLSGQTIVREAHYGLLIVRCPECGTPAALQEYPALGRWAPRLGSFAAAVWLGLMILLVCASSLILWREATDVAGRLAWPYVDRVQRGWSAYAAEEAAKAQAAGKTATLNVWTYGYNTNEEKKWWEAQDKDAMFRELGSWWHGGIAWNSLWLLVQVTLVLASLGCLMAICTPHLRTRGRLLMVLAVIALGAVFTLMNWSSRRGFGWYGYVGNYTSTESLSRLWPYLMPPVLVVCGALYGIGVWQGRRIARGVVGFLLPPSMRGPLAFLWHCDGLPMPRPRR